MLTINQIFSHCSNVPPDAKFNLYNEWDDYFNQRAPEKSSDYDGLSSEDLTKIVCSFHLSNDGKTVDVYFYNEIK